MGSGVARHGVAVRYARSSACGGRGRLAAGRAFRPAFGKRLGPPRGAGERRARAGKRRCRARAGKRRWRGGAWKQAAGAARGEGPGLLARSAGCEALGGAVAAAGGMPVFPRSLLRGELLPAAVC
jgi:hypothetical protein